MTFRALTSDSSTMLATVARFLALLELFRDGAVAFQQLTPLGELTGSMDRRRERRLDGLR
jgi:segregation and condensation protein A